MSRAITGVETALRAPLERVLADTRNASADATVKVLKRRLKGLRAAAPGTAEIAGFAFDRTDPNAVAWVKDHAAETITEISTTTREAIKELVEDAFDGEFGIDELSGEIAGLLGDENRAELIASTETMTASNRGQQQAWEQAAEEGLLAGTETQVWIVTPDDHLCPLCEPMEDATSPIGGTFTTDDGESDGPPLHPRCRCTAGLTLE